MCCCALRRQPKTSGLRAPDAARAGAGGGCARASVTQVCQRIVALKWLNTLRARMCACTQVLAEAARVLRPGGILIITFTDKCLASKALLGWKERGNLERSELVQDLVRWCL